jgi:hypothetical protein
MKKNEQQKPVSMKKPYTTPKLTEHGSVAQLTRGIGGSNFDHGQNNSTRRGGD